MINISAEKFAKNCIHTIELLRKGKEPILWIRIKHIGRKLAVKNIFDLVDKKLKTNFKLESRNLKLESIEDMDQNLLMTLNLCMLINAL